MQSQSYNAHKTPPHSNTQHEEDSQRGGEERKAPLDRLSREQGGEFAVGVDASEFWLDLEERVGGSLFAYASYERSDGD